MMTVGFSLHRWQRYSFMELVKGRQRFQLRKVTNDFILRNRILAPCDGGEQSTTEPTMLSNQCEKCLITN